jgi:SAM-dependent methyltransferase
MIEALNIHVPNWRNIAVHESSPSGPASRKLRTEAKSYSASQYLLPDLPRGAVVREVTCQDLEQLTFPDESFDLFITQDVLEHVLRPELALREIERVLRRGGAHVFTVPIFHGRRTLIRVLPSDSGIHHLLPPDYHGNPVDPNGSLVIREWGDDFIEFVRAESGLFTEMLPFDDRSRGLDGEFLEVFITRKL